MNRPILPLLIAGVLMFATAAVATSANAAGYKANYRYGRCTTATPKDYRSCYDVASKGGAAYQIQFNVMKAYCDYIKPQPLGSAWNYYGIIKLKRGKLSGKITYNNLLPEYHDQANDYEIVFTWSGRLVGSNTMRLTLKGRVTKTGSDPLVQKCKDISFTETHVLHAVRW